MHQLLEVVAKDIVPALIEAQDRHPSPIATRPAHWMGLMPPHLVEWQDSNDDIDIIPVQGAKGTWYWALRQEDVTRTLRHDSPVEPGCTSDPSQSTRRLPCAAKSPANDLPRLDVRLVCLLATFVAFAAGLMVGMHLAVHLTRNQ